MNLALNITEAEIDLGVPDNQDECPVAWALKQKFPKQRVLVLNHICVVGDKAYGAQGLGEFIKAFDSNQEVKPIVLQLYEV